MLVSIPKLDCMLEHYKKKIMASLFHQISGKFPLTKIGMKEVHILIWACGVNPN